MQEKQENQEQTATEQTEVTVKVEDQKLEFIPFILYQNQMRVLFQIEKRTLLALITVSAALKEINPEHEALTKAQAIMEQGLPLLPESQRIEDVVDAARKAVNNSIYGVEEIHDSN